LLLHFVPLAPIHLALWCTHNVLYTQLAPLDAVVLGLVAPDQISINNPPQTTRRMDLRTVEESTDELVQAVEKDVLVFVLSLKRPARMQRQH
jgi:hypothetical protein